jgi:hypothetical protein
MRKPQNMPDLMACAFATTAQTRPAPPERR